MGLTAQRRIELMSDANAQLPFKRLVLPAYPASLVKRLPELTEHHRAMQAAVDDFVKALNVTSARPPSVI